MGRKEKIISYSIVIIIGLFMAIGICSSKNILNQPTLEVIKILSDAFLLPASIFCGLGILIFVSNKGSFNMLVYGTKTFFSHLLRMTEFRERYADYYEYNKHKQKEQAQFGFILVPGILFLTLAVLFTVIYSSI